MEQEVDSEFYEWVIDEDGEDKKFLKNQSPENLKCSGFTTFDTSYGHCGFC